MERECLLFLCSLGFTWKDWVSAMSRGKASSVDCNFKGQGPYQSFLNSHLTLPARILKEIFSLCGTSLYCAAAEGGCRAEFLSRDVELGKEIGFFWAYSKAQLKFLENCGGKLPLSWIPRQYEERSTKLSLTCLSGEKTSAQQTGRSTISIRSVRGISEWLRLSGCSEGCFIFSAHLV